MFPVVDSTLGWLRQIEKRLSLLERRAPNMVGVVIPVPSDADQASVVAWYQPTARKPLLIDRVDTAIVPDIRYTNDGVTWFRVDFTAV